MKKLKLPEIDDNTILNNLAENNKLSSHPNLKDEISEIETQYNNYLNFNGNPWKFHAKNISDKLKNGLKNHYKSSLTSIPDLDFINNMRKSSPDVCPMCGSFKSDTIEHYLPKENYPEFSVFSKNLIPSCQCNSKRGLTTKGRSDIEERIIHPYYDDQIRTRMVGCYIENIEDSLEFNIKLVNLCDDESFKNNVAFHIEHLIEKNGILLWLASQIDRLIENPRTIILSIPKKIMDYDKIYEFSKDILELYDEKYDTPNNWNSIFIYGLINSPGVIDWIVERHNGLVSGIYHPAD